jgi:hypothetical protein
MLRVYLIQSTIYSVYDTYLTGLLDMTHPHTAIESNSDDYIHEWFGLVWLEIYVLCIENGHVTVHS